jgi:hypothetical protein
MLQFGLAAVASAQDSHYWTSQFGNRARLLGGAVIGSATDLSAVYYNPGAVALMDEPELLLSANTFQYSSLTVKDGLGPGEDVSSSRFNLTPSLVAGEIKFDALGKNRVAYAFLTRREAQGRILDRAAVTDIFPNPVGFASAEVSLDTRLSEYWIGGSWSRKLSESVGIGVSPFLTVRNHRLKVQGLTQALFDSGAGGIAVAGRDYDYQTWGFLAKASLATKWQKWQLGFTITTPNLGLFGSGDTGLDRSEVIEGVGTEITTDFQNGIDAAYRSPLSLGFGAARSFGSTKLHLSAEWFNDMGPRTVLDTEPFQSQSTGETFDNNLVYQLDRVFNVAVGFEQKFSEDLAAYFGFRTDFSAVNSADNVSNDTVSRWDLYHVSGGATFTVAGSELTVGGDVAFGESQIGENDVGLERDLTTIFVRATFVLGFNFTFGS